MNIVIVGCGNIGLEVAKRLSGEHSLLLMNHSCSEEMSEFIRKHDNVWFSLADATDQLNIEAALSKSDGRFNRVDALVCTVGAYCTTSALSDIKQFKRAFNLNFFGNLVPIQVVLKRMLPIESGRIVVISSTSGVFTYPGLTAYPPAKWALTNVCQTLRQEVKPYGIFVDVVFPRTIKNQRSKTFLSEAGIESNDVAAVVAGLLKRGGSTDRFIPRQYSMLRLLERVFPHVLDKKAGLKAERKGHFHSQKIERVVIVGACSGLGRELAKMYAQTVGRLLLVGYNISVLLPLQKYIERSADCRVDIANLDVGNNGAASDLAGQIRSTDLLVINSTRVSTKGRINDTPIVAYEGNLATTFFGVVELIVESLRRDQMPAKVITILSSDALEGRSGESCHSTGQAALWAFTRSLRRTFGHDRQIMEVILDTLGEDHCECIDSTEPESKTCRTGDGSSSDKAQIAMDPARKAKTIYDTEKEGKEIVFVPRRIKAAMYLEAIAGGLLG
jgi:NAD(P)-dependent dehydrogenase (short-subunit alcohol dehydrogenase family)